MPSYKPKYSVTAINTQNHHQLCREFQGSPSDGKIADWLSTKGWLQGHRMLTGQPVVVVRYFPTEKGWKVLNLTAAQKVQTSGKRASFWTGIKKGERVYPNEDAAIMSVVHKLKQQRAAD